MQPSLDDIVIGSVVQISAAIKNMAGVLADPSALRLKVRDPSGTITNYVFGNAAEIVKLAPGEYRADLVMTAAGKWTYRWEADAPNAGAAEGLIVVKKSIVI